MLFRAGHLACHLRPHLDRGQRFDRADRRDRHRNGLRDDGGGDDQIVPDADSGPLSATLLKNGTLKTYKGFPHGMPTTEAETINGTVGVSEGVMLFTFWLIDF